MRVEYRNRLEKKKGEENRGLLNTFCYALLFAVGHGNGVLRRAKGKRLIAHQQRFWRAHPTCPHPTNQTRPILATRRANPSINQSIDRSIESFRCVLGPSGAELKKTEYLFLIERFARLNLISFVVETSSWACAHRRSLLSPKIGSSQGAPSFLLA